MQCPAQFSVDALLAQRSHRQAIPPEAAQSKPSRPSPERFALIFSVDGNLHRFPHEQPLTNSSRRCQTEEVVHQSAGYRPPTAGLRDRCGSTKIVDRMPKWRYICAGIHRSALWGSIQLFLHPSLQAAIRVLELYSSLPSHS